MCVHVRVVFLQALPPDVRACVRAGGLNLVRACRLIRAAMRFDQGQEAVLLVVGAC